MKRFTAVVLCGVVIGAVARGLMLVAALVSGSRPEFSLPGSGLIMGIFILLGVVGFVAAALGRWRRAAGWTAGVLVLPLWVPGFSIGIVEVSENSEKLSAAPLAAVAALAALILVGYVAMPIIGWRLGRGSRTVR